MGLSSLTDEIRNAAWESSKIHKVELDLILAMIHVESSGNRYKIRFEKNWSYFKDVDIWAFNRQISENTERISQMHSWGLLQIMGSVARELKFDGDLPELTDNKIGVYYGTMKIKQLQNKYISTLDVVAAYNAGLPKKNASGRYLNQGYVDKVMSALSEIQKGKQ